MDPAPALRWLPALRSTTPRSTPELRSTTPRSTTPRWTPGRRWAVVLTGTAAVVALVLGGLPATGSAPSTTPARLLERVAASAEVPHTGTAISTGALGLPDLPRLTGVASLLGQSTRTRVWWASAQRWRVDVVTTTGERGTYLDGDRVRTWDYESDEVTDAPAPTGAHLPLALDLQPDQVARDVVAGPGGAAAAARGASLLGSRRIAGRVTDGVRVRAADARSTLAAVDVWVDRGSGLPLAVDLLDDAGVAALTSRYDAVRLTDPAPAALVSPDPAGARSDRAADDLVADVDEFSPWRLPTSLAGLDALLDPATTSSGADDPPGVIAYGTGLTRLAVVPLPPNLTDRALTTARAAGGIDLPDPSGTVAAHDSEAVLVRSGALSLVFVNADRGRAWILGGPLTPAVLTDVTDALLDDPPAWRRSR